MSEFTRGKGRGGKGEGEKGEGEKDERTKDKGTFSTTRPTPFPLRFVAAPAMSRPSEFSRTERAVS